MSTILLSHAKAKKAADHIAHKNASQARRQAEAPELLLSSCSEADSDQQTVSSNSDDEEPNIGGPVTRQVAVNQENRYLMWHVGNSRLELVLDTENFRLWQNGHIIRNVHFELKQKQHTRYPRGSKAVLEVRSPELNRNGLLLSARLFSSLDLLDSSFSLKTSLTRSDLEHLKHAFDFHMDHWTVTVKK